MPDNDGKLSKEQTEKFLKWLNEKGTGHTCPVCNENNWTIGDKLMRSEFYTPGVMTLGGPHLPMAFMLCNNCMYIRQFAAIPIGLVDSEKPEEEADG